MFLSPIQYKTKGASREFTADDFQGRDVDPRFEPGVADTEARRRMVFPEHLEQVCPKQRDLRLVRRPRGPHSGTALRRLLPQRLVQHASQPLSRAQQLQTQHRDRLFEVGLI